MIAATTTNETCVLGSGTVDSIELTGRSSVVGGGTSNRRALISATLAKSFIVDAEPV